jgi:hypothetical protein
MIGLAMDDALTLDALLDLIEQRRGVTREQAREVLAIMPGGTELLSGTVPVEQSLLAAELVRDDPE